MDPPEEPPPSDPKEPQPKEPDRRKKQKTTHDIPEALLRKNKRNIMVNKKGNHEIKLTGVKVKDKHVSCSIRKIETDPFLEECKFNDGKELARKKNSLVFTAIHQDFNYDNMPQHVDKDGTDSYNTVYSWPYHMFTVTPIFRGLSDDASKVECFFLNQYWFFVKVTFFTNIAEDVQMYIPGKFPQKAGNGKKDLKFGSKYTISRQLWPYYVRLILLSDPCPPQDEYSPSADDIFYSVSDSTHSLIKPKWRVLHDEIIKIPCDYMCPTNTYEICFKWHPKEEFKNLGKIPGNNMGTHNLNIENYGSIFCVKAVDYQSTFKMLRLKNDKIGDDTNRFGRFIDYSEGSFGLPSIMDRCSEGVNIVPEVTPGGVTINDVVRNALSTLIQETRERSRLIKNNIDLSEKVNDNGKRSIVELSDEEENVRVTNIKGKEFEVSDDVNNISQNSGRLNEIISNLFNE